jgi:general stress protein 26
MDKEKLKKKILKVIKDYPVASVATVDGDKPHVRYMVVQADDDLVVWTATFANSRKIDQIKNNANIHLAIGADSKDWFKSFVNYAGTAEIHEDAETKKKFWHDSLSKFFKDSEDPNYIVLKIMPETIELMDHDSMRLETYELKKDRLKTKG